MLFGLNLFGRFKHSAGYMAKHLRILHVYRTYFPDPPGGLQEAIRQIALASSAQGCEARVFTLSPSPTPAVINRPEGQVHRCRSWAAPASCDIGGYGSIQQFSELAQWADVLHYHFPWPFADLLHVLTRPKRPAVMTYHSDIVRQRWLGLAYSPLMKRMLASMRAIVATSPAYAETSAELSKAAYGNRLRIIPLGIDEQSYVNGDDTPVPPRLGLKPGEPFFLFIGVLRYYKGLHTLLKAANTVQARVVIAGSGDEQAALQHQAKLLGLSNVVFAGQVSKAEKIALLKHCLAFVLPSHLRSEAFGMVLVEAALFGKPMLSCEVGTGTSFVNSHLETGLVVPPESPAALAAAMNQLLHDSEIAQTFGRAARLRYEALFSGRALGEAYSALYRDAVGMNP